MTFYTHNPIAIRSKEPVTQKELKKLFPTIFQTEAHNSRSERYQHLPTSEVLSALEDKGFKVFAASVSRIRKDMSRIGFQGHMLRLRKPGNELPKLGGIFPEVVLRNSHDGSTRYEMKAGLFRLICLNGMVVGDKMIGSIRLTHTTRSLEVYQASAERITQQMGEVVELLPRFQETKLTQKVQLEIAREVMDFRFHRMAFPLERLLEARRKADEGNDAWSVMNRIQENIMKGGLEYQLTEEGRKRKSAVTREVSKITDELNYNQWLWDLVSSKVKGLPKPKLIEATAN